MNCVTRLVAIASLAAAVACQQAPPAAEPAAATAPTRAPAGPKPKYAAIVPASVTTPDTVQTRIGTLKFSDGLPDADTVKKVYDNLDFGRGVEAFLLGIPAANVQGLRRGFIEAGFPSNQGFGISESLADARSLFLTPNTVVVYTWGYLDVKDGPMVAGGAARRAGHSRRRPLPLRHRPRADRARPGQGRQVPGGAAGLQGRAAQGRATSSRRRAPTATSSSCAPSSRAATWRPS